MVGIPDQFRPGNWREIMPNLVNDIEGIKPETRECHFKIDIRQKIESDT